MIRRELDRLQTELKIRGFSPLTVRNYSFFVQKFLEHRKKEPEILEEEDIKSYISELFDTKSKNTIMLAIASIKFYYTELLKKETGNIRVPKKDMILPEVLTKEEVRKLFSLFYCQ